MFNIDCNAQARNGLSASREGGQVECTINLSSVQYCCYNTVFFFFFFKNLNIFIQE